MAPAAWSDEAWRKRLVEARAHVPQLATAGVVTVTLAVKVFAPAPCGEPCANAHGGGAATLPANFDVEPVPTQMNPQPVRGGPTATAGTATLR